MSITAIVLWLNVRVVLTVTDKYYSRPGPWPHDIYSKITAHRGWPIAHSELRFVVRPRIVPSVMAQDPSPLKQHRWTFSATNCLANAMIGVLIVGITTFASVKKGFLTRIAD